MDPNSPPGMNSLIWSDHALSPGLPINSLKEVLGNPQLKRREFFTGGGTSGVKDMDFLPGFSLQIQPLASSPVEAGASYR